MPLPLPFRIPARFATRRTTGLRCVAALMVAAGLVAMAGCAPSRLKESKRLIALSEPFQQSPASPTASLLVVGDSTAVGTGASLPAHSLPGLIAQDHPRLRIVNLAQDGAKFEGIAEQLAGTERYDMVLIMGGGNDAIRFTRKAPWQEAMALSVSRASARADTVILMPSGNVGNAPFFHAPVSWLMTQRARTLQGMGSEIAKAQGAVYVNLYRERQDDPFAQQPERFNASDMLHPNDAGYVNWYGELRRQAGLDARLKALESRPAAAAR